MTRIGRPKREIEVIPTEDWPEPEDLPEPKPDREPVPQPEPDREPVEVP